MSGVASLCCFSTGDDVRRQLNIAKWVYTALFTIVQVVTWLLRTYGDQAFQKHNIFAAFCTRPGSSVTSSALCSGQQVVLRFSFAMFSFFALHCILLFWCKRESDARLGLHTGGWFWKCLVWAGALVGFLFVPGDAIFYYGNVARFGAGLFLVVVMVEMVTWAYSLNEALVARDNWWSWTVLIVGALVTFAGGLACIGASYHFYATSRTCSLNLFFITWSLVVGLAMVAVLFVPRRLEAAGLLTGGVVFAYTSYLLLSALSSQPINDCIRETGVQPQWIQIVGFFLGIGAVCYSTLTLGTSQLFGSGDPDNGQLPYRPDAFHLIFALASMYMAMLLCNWELSSSADDMWRIDRGWASMWVKMASKWFCELLYLWTVLAPAILRNREFT